MKTYIVDAFTDTQFKGNPAGVCILEKELPKSTMLAIAKELNLSETAFLQKLENEYYHIRYFSPRMEIPLCGHATLAASHVIFNSGKSTTLKFKTIEGVLLTTSRQDSIIEMEFPVYDLVNIHVPSKMLEALGINSFVSAQYNVETKIIMLEIFSSEQLQELNPDFLQLVKSHDSINGVVVTAKSNDSNYDFYSRYFWPWSGTNEDPVTGGTHTFLAKYWSEKLDKKTFRSFQCSNRTGFMEVELTSQNSVLIRGKAISVLEGNLNLRHEH